MTFPNRPARTLATPSGTQLNLLVPAGEYAEGLQSVAISNRNGRETSTWESCITHGGPKLYFPAAIALKWPTILLLIFFASLLAGNSRACRAPGDLLIMSLFGLVFLAFALQSRITIGERHLLPLYPFALLIAGGIWEHARRQRAASAILVVALCLNAADALRCAPDYLGVLQYLRAARKRLAAAHRQQPGLGTGIDRAARLPTATSAEPLYLAYYGPVAPRLYGIRAATLPPDQRVQGTIVIGESCLSGQVLDDAGNDCSYSWLQSYRPQRVLGHSMWMFDPAAQ